MPRTRSTRRRWLLGAGAGALSLSLPGVWRCAVERARGVPGRQLCLAGEARADIWVQVLNEMGGSRLLRESRNEGPGGDHVRLEVWHDEVGELVQATYRRRGPWGEQRAALSATSSGARIVDTTFGREQPLGPEEVVLVESLDAGIIPRPSAATSSARLFDFASGDHLPVTLVREGADTVAYDEAGHVLIRWPPRGARLGPGSFAERDPSASGACPSPQAPLRPVVDAASLWGQWRVTGVHPGWPRVALVGPGQEIVAASAGRTPDEVTLRMDPMLRDLRSPAPAHLSPAWGLESDEDAVVRFARQVAGGAARGPLVDALALGEAIGGRMAARPDAGPPSALRMLAAFRGDCDHATALLVACLRALGHPARALVGYRVWQGRLAPHAWAECWEDRRGWLPVDPTLPGIGPFHTHLRLFHGLGSPFTLGRTLGRLGLHPV